MAVLFEDQPLTLVLLVVAVVEGWLRVRVLLFRTARRLLESWRQGSGERGAAR